MNKPTIVVSVEGSIGAGKSTLLKQLEDARFAQDHVVVYEPVDTWMRAKPPGCKHSVFEMYYEDKNRWGFMFQMFVLQTRVEHLSRVIAANPGRIIITERCPLTDCEVFAKMLRDQKVMASSEYFAYERWYEFVRCLVPPVNGIIYLRVPPDVCAQRITRRNRTGEGSIDCDYLRSLHAQHEKWLGSGQAGGSGAAAGGLPVLTVDGTADGPVDLSHITQFLQDMACAV